MIYGRRVVRLSESSLLFRPIRPLFTAHAALDPRRAAYIEMVSGNCTMVNFQRRIFRQNSNFYGSFMVMV